MPIIANRRLPLLSHLSGRCYIGSNTAALAKTKCIGKLMRENDDLSKGAQLVDVNGESYYKIEHIDNMRPFFMSMVSPHDHWMFISSNGGLTAGRKNAEYALFPYYTDDKITESAHLTGSKTLFQITTENVIKIWEPFTGDIADQSAISRNIYKSKIGNKIIFEEVNHHAQLAFSYQWSSSEQYGFVRKSKLSNLGPNDVSVVLLDGLQNIMPYGVGSELQNRTSNLVDAYKRSELDITSGLGIFALSTIIVDRAEPSEALKANIVWASGLENPTHLLSSLQVANFRNKKEIHQELDIKAEKGAYFVSQDFTISAHTSKEWAIIADVNYNHTATIHLIKSIKEDGNLYSQVIQDVEQGTNDLIRLVACADGLQRTADTLKDDRHFANVLFNIMRGGVFDDHYNLKKSDFLKYLDKVNRNVLQHNRSFLEELPDVFNLFELKEYLTHTQDQTLIRLSTEYLPLKFSRRHGDPSRPWNKFSINLKNESDGSKILDYEGNWRDIFQNWEALAYSYPSFIEGMIFKFLNASTFDGYNPYRVTMGGFDWETIEPDDPWSYIGYWGDHQIIYLLKLLECLERHQPNRLVELFSKQLFVYAAVPYRIKPFEEIIKNPKDTVEFDHEQDTITRDQKKQFGSDGALLQAPIGQIYHVNLIEKILATLLAKMSNFIPEAGIWLNTQRPEWNDANNALVGNGVSMVTLFYLQRFIRFIKVRFESSNIQSVHISKELIAYFNGINETLSKLFSKLDDRLTDSVRLEVTTRLGSIASDYRQSIYGSGFSGEKSELTLDDINDFFNTCNICLDQSIKVNQRPDQLYHSYNIIDAQEHELVVSHLSEMLEGQVALLSSGSLSSAQALQVLDALKSSALYRSDQYSYILYPNKSLPGFLDKNKIQKKDIAESTLLKKLASDGNTEIIEEDVLGDFHFNGNFKNSSDLDVALANLSQSDYGALIPSDQEYVLRLFEKVFNHKEFTGRSGTFYGYEGLGSIYWHMVSKLLLAVQECYLKAIDENAPNNMQDQLATHYYEIYQGLGIHKSPQLYGAFTTDPYSHTPAGKGAQQPGMTGQVKEDILSRFGELGVHVIEKKIHFAPSLLSTEEFLLEESSFQFVNVSNEYQNLTLDQGSLAFTYCQIPIIYILSDLNQIVVTYRDGTMHLVQSLTLNTRQSNDVFQRTGTIDHIQVFIKKSLLNSSRQNK